MRNLPDTPLSQRAERGERRSSGASRHECAAVAEDGRGLCPGVVHFLCSEDYCEISVKSKKHRRSNDEIVSRWRQQCEDRKIVST